ncbi:hypothetical protein [Kordiimonas sp. SCSIO 12610]|uniref:hypothetical protein n=1 Tax=Kordiimonas sp. SCSIO 12610 TaxID=2829597 RepID=UPI00210BC0DC|nr:hypothetical protein [Kordiimonas sp. SCSIO 12610]UTW56808.1 hypothetical protein KFF44_07955 [Kordiimonas sp. SCSIO 12610]
MRTLFSREKNFADKWVGHPMLNALGLHTFRMRLAKACNTIRFRQTGLRENKACKSSSLWIYLTVHGDEETGEDLQKNIHRDTFFSSMKFWFFLRPVTIKDDPFAYARGSHKLTKKRLDWEQKKALAAIHNNAEDSDGSFRINEQELSGLNIEKPDVITVPENTLVIADTLGFHHRSFAEKGRERLALYGNLRPHPFALFSN